MSATRDKVRTIRFAGRVWKRDEFDTWFETPWGTKLCVWKSQFCPKVRAWVWIAGTITSNGVGEKTPQEAMRAAVAARKMA